MRDRLNSSRIKNGSYEGTHNSGNLTARNESCQGDDMKRRDFLSTALAVAAAGLAPRSARASSGFIEVMLDEPIGDIAPELHGHFTEHIGSVIYGGVWVGENSRMTVSRTICAIVDRGISGLTSW